MRDKRLALQLSSDSAIQCYLPTSCRSPNAYCIVSCCPVYLKCCKCPSTEDMDPSNLTQWIIQDVIIGENEKRRSISTNAELVITYGEEENWDKLKIKRLVQGGDNHSTVYESEPICHLVAIEEFTWVLISHSFKLKTRFPLLFLLSKYRNSLTIYSCSCCFLVPDKERWNRPTIKNT